MPTYQFEAMDATGQEIKDVIEAATEDEAQATIRQMGYFVTKISVKKGPETAARSERPRGSKRFALGGVKQQAPDHLHPAALDSAGRRPADPPQPADSRRAVPSRAPEELPDRRLRRDRRRVPRSPRPWPSRPRPSTACT